MRTTYKTLGIWSSLATLTLVTMGCYRLSGDCELNLCAPVKPTSGTSSGGGGSTTTTTTTTTTTDAAGGGSGGAPEAGPPPTCDPASNQGPVADTCGVFVSSTAAIGGNGTKASPLATLQDAVAAASAGGMRTVYACVGSFVGALQIPAGVTVYGGLDCNDGWAPGAGKTQITASPGVVPLRLGAGEAATTVLDVAVQAQSAVVPGGSAIAVIADGVTATLVRCDLAAGDGADGASGVDGGAQKPPAAPGTGAAAACGNQAAVPFSPLGGTGGTNVCDGVTLFGGPGGYGGLAPSSGGQTGQPGDFGAGALPGAGADGGLDGALGGGGNGDGQLSSDGFLGPNGGDGSAGNRGESGGGGSGSKAGLSCNGAGGGGGGAGGCGGQPGTGGQAGGSSIALVSLGSTLTLSGVTLTTGNAGHGGRGGDGQFGQAGGGGGAGGQGVGGIASGAGGGGGGSGGNGGPGGGAAGGHALGIAFTGTAPAGAPTMVLGAAGDGGSGGTNGVNAAGDGAPGQQANTLAF